MRQHLQFTLTSSSIPSCCKKNHLLQAQGDTQTWSPRDSTSTKLQNPGQHYTHCHLHRESSPCCQAEGNSQRKPPTAMTKPRTAGITPASLNNAASRERFLERRICFVNGDIKQPPSLQLGTTQLFRTVKQVFQEDRSS